MMCHTYKHGKEQEGQRRFGRRADSCQPANRRSRDGDGDKSGQKAFDAARRSPAPHSRHPRPNSMRPVFLQPRIGVLVRRLALVGAVAMASWILGAIMYVMAVAAISRRG
jgi:hypothetical protein